MLQTLRRRAKIELLTLNETTNLLVTMSEDPKIPMKILGESWKAQPQFRNKRHGFSFCNCFQTDKVPHPLTLKKYCITSVYWHLLLSMIQPHFTFFTMFLDSSNYSFLPSIRSQSFEPYRAYYTLYHITSSFIKLLNGGIPLFFRVFPSKNHHFYFRSLTRQETLTKLLLNKLIISIILIQSTQKLLIRWKEISSL